MAIGVVVLAAGVFAGVPLIIASSSVQVVHLVVLAAGVVVLAAGVIVLAEWFFAGVHLIIASSYVQIVRQYQVTQRGLLILLV